MLRWLFLLQYCSPRYRVEARGPGNPPTPHPGGSNPSAEGGRGQKQLSSSYFCELGNKTRQLGRRACPRGARRWCNCPDVKDMPPALQRWFRWAVRQLSSDKRQRFCQSARLPPLRPGKTLPPPALPARQGLCRLPACRTGSSTTCPNTDRAPAAAETACPAVPQRGARHHRGPRCAAGPSRHHIRPCLLQAPASRCWRRGCRPATGLTSRLARAPAVSLPEGMQTILPLSSDAVALQAGQGQACCPGACSGFYRHLGFLLTESLPRRKKL